MTFTRFRFSWDLQESLSFNVTFRRFWVFMGLKGELEFQCDLQKILSIYGTYRRAWVSMLPSEDFWAFLRLTGELEFEWAWFHGGGRRRGGHGSLVLAGVLIHDQIVRVAVILRVLSTLVDKTRVTQFPFSFTEKKMINQIIIALINPG